MLLELVDVAGILFDAAPRSLALIADCSNALDALDRCRAVTPRTTLPVLMCTLRHDSLYTYLQWTVRRFWAVSGP